MRGLVAPDCRGLLATALVVLALALGGCTSAPKAAPRAPALSAPLFQPREIDLGRVPWESEHAIATRLINHGAQSIRVAAMTASCDCAGFDPARYVGREIAPGAAMELSFNIRVGQRLGSRRSEIELLTEAGTVYWFSIRYDCFATFVCSPSELIFKAVHLDAEEDSDDAVHSVVFRSDTARIERVESDAPWLDATWDDSRQEEAIIYAHIARDHLAHEWQVATLRVATTDPYVSMFPIRVSARGVAALRAIPGHVFVRRGRSAGVMFVRADGAMGRIESVDSDSRDFNVEFVPGSSQVRIEPGLASTIGVHRFHVRDTSGVTTRFLVSVRPRLDSDTEGDRHEIPSP